MTLNPHVVSCSWLNTQLDNPDIVIVDCRFQLANPNWGQQQYLASHIPGAYYLDLERDLSSPQERHGGRHPLPNPDTFAQTLANLGVHWGKTQIVAYDDSRFAFASRLWWLCRYIGHEAVALLDGGWPAWQQQGYPVTNALPTLQLGTLIAQPQRDSIVDIEGVKAAQNSPNVILIDSRDGDRYRGEIEPIDPIAGHIPSAFNSPWQQITDAQGYILPLEEQQRIWQHYSPEQELIVYCGSGVTACVNLLSLNLIGINTAKLYPGGWSDWCSYLIDT